jgi:hypothetical protein
MSDSAHILLPGHQGDKKESRVRDFIFTLVTIGFFLVAIGYLRGCERLK